MPAVSGVMRSLRPLPWQLTCAPAPKCASAQVSEVSSEAETKGLEFDAVLVVEPERILADGPRGAAELYVALTRATQRLGVLHHGPLPQALTGLAETGTPTHAGQQR